MPEYELVVRQSFGDYLRGDVITDQAEVAKLLEQERDHTHVIKRARAAIEPASDAAPEKPPATSPSPDAAAPAEGH